MILPSVPDAADIGDVVTPLPDHPDLASVARAIEQNSQAAWLLDADYSVIWMSTEWVQMVGTEVERHVGSHFVTMTLSPEVRSIITERSLMRSGIELLPMFTAVTPGGKDGVRALFAEALGPEAGDVVAGAPELEGIAARTTVDVQLSPGMSPVSVNAIQVMLRDRHGATIGVLALFGASMPFRFIPLLARGDQATLDRTIRLAEPRQRQAAILFADLQSSGVLSSRLPSPIYFRLIQDVTAAIDDAVTAHGGVVGRHAGDGVTAFLVVEEGGSASATAHDTIAAARAIRTAAAAIAARYAEETPGLIDQSDLLINVGLHWGDALYMGQLSTNGRLEVTALGDQVNECARIQDCATDGAILGSKQLLEHLTPEHAMAIGCNLNTISYQRLAEFGNASAKAVRDAGGIPLAAIS